MTRSGVNGIIRESKAFLRKCNFHLPPFAHWTPRQWQDKGHECDEIRANMLGWDITDFGLGDFDRWGLLLFTLRNGNCDRPEDPKSYCEKIFVARPGQRCPMHFHWNKVEDIINRAGGELVIKLFNSGPEEQPDESSPVSVGLDGVLTETPAGARLRLRPGESICLTTGLYHEFWAENGTVLCGEVSAVNDDTRDNRFAQPVGRFPDIEEDEPPLHYLCNEYPPAG